MADTPVSIGPILDIIKSLGLLIKSVAKGIEAAYKTSMFIVDDHRARNTQTSLRKVLAANNKLIYSQAHPLYRIKSYLRDQNKWEKFKEGLEQVSHIVDESTKLLKDMSPKLSPTLATQISVLSHLYVGRADLLDQIRTLPTPKNSDDLTGLKALGDQWLILHKELIELNITMGRAMKPAKSRKPRETK